MKILSKNKNKIVTNNGPEYFVPKIIPTMIPSFKK